MDSLALEFALDRSTMRSTASLSQEKESVRPQISITLLNISKYIGQQKASEGAQTRSLINTAHASGVQFLKAILKLLNPYHKPLTWIQERSSANGHSRR